MPVECSPMSVVNVDSVDVVVDGESLGAIRIEIQHVERQEIFFARRNGGTIDSL